MLHELDSLTGCIQSSIVVYLAPVLMCRLCQLANSIQYLTPNQVTWHPNTARSPEATPKGLDGSKGMFVINKSGATFF